MLQSYSNPTIFKPTMTKKLAEGITSKKATNWGNSVVTWVSIDIVSSNVEYSLTEIKKTREDFKSSFNNLRKYPKMTEKDWK